MPAGLHRRLFHNLTVSLRTAHTRTMSWKPSAPSPPHNTITFAAQRRLPKLPLPPLDDTLARLKDSLRPLAWSEDELREAEKKIDDFGKHASVLHKRLQERRERTNHWLEEWWDEAAYFGYRDSVRVSINADPFSFRSLMSQLRRS